MNIRLKIKQLINTHASTKLFERIFKQRCLLCTSHEGAELGFCAPCYASLPWHHAPQCPKCGLTTNGMICGSCLNATPYYDATHSLFSYDFPLDVMMQRYKYGNMLNLGQVFGNMLIHKTNLDTVDLVIAMPMHNKRLNQRGFNQALEIAKILTKNKPEKLDYHSVQRQKFTPPQASLPLKQRVKNIKGVFSVASDLSGKRIALVDDVMTTGASLNELAKTLKQAGAIYIECWVVARTLQK